MQLVFPFPTIPASSGPVAEFVPQAVASLPDELLALPAGDVGEKILRAKAALKWLLVNHRTAYSVSYGKDSSATLGLALAAAAELAAQGRSIQPFVVMTADTGVENPRSAQLAASETAKVQAWIDRHGLPGSVHVARPSLSSSFAVSVLGGRSLPSMAGAKRDCTSDWKIVPLTRLRKQVIGKQDVVTVTGVRRAESAVRANNLRRRAESDSALVQTAADGHVAFAPLIEWSYDDVFDYLGQCANGLEHTYSDFRDVIDLYREATGECVISGSDASRAETPCGARTGCFTCLAVTDDKSMDQMIREPGNAYMKPLAAFRRFMADTYWDMSRRTWIGRSIDKSGNIRLAPDGYSPAMLQDLLRYALTIDIDERQAASRLGIAPRFQIVSLEALFAISAHWSLQGFALPYTAWRIYREIERGARYPVPTVAASPRTQMPSPRFIHVGDWDKDADGRYTGLRDPLVEAFGGAGCIGHKEIAFAGRLRTIMDVGTGDFFSINPEGASLFLEFELDEKIAYWHGKEAPRRVEGFHYAATEYRDYVRFGFLSVAKGQEGKVDQILRRTSWRERAGLAGYQFDQGAAMENLKTPVAHSA